MEFFKFTEVGETPVEHGTGEIITGDARDQVKLLSSKSISCCITSPPYFGLRDYGTSNQIGLEQSPEEYISEMVDLFRDIRRVLRDDGTLWLNIGDSYAGGGGHSPNAPSNIPSATRSKSGKYGMALRSGGIKPRGQVKRKDLVGIPWRLALALQAGWSLCTTCKTEMRSDLWPAMNGDKFCLPCALEAKPSFIRQSEIGWYLRQDIIWEKTNAMPQHVSDRCSQSHEYLFLLSKSPKYHFDHEAIKEPTTDGKKLRNKRSVWSVNTKPFAGAHFATFPVTLIEPCILAGCPVGGTVLDPFLGSGTTAIAAAKNGRNWLGIELNPDYAEMARKRIADAL